MIKKTFILIIGLYSLTIGLSVFQSCGLMEYDTWICKILFSSVYQDADTDDTDFGKIDFELSGIDNCQSAFNIFKFDLIQSCYATTKSKNWQNSIEIESIQLILDKCIIIKNDTVYAGKNILTNDMINNGTNILIEEGYQVHKVKIAIDAETGRLIEFENGIYEIIFKCSTSDNRELEDIYEYEFNM